MYCNAKEGAESMKERRASKRLMEEVDEVIREIELQQERERKQNAKKT